MSARLALTVLSVRDLAAAVAFYRAAFGFEVTVDEPSYVEMSVPGGMRLGLYDAAAWARLTGAAATHPPAGGLSPAELYFECDDLDADIASMKAAGARVLSERSDRDWGDACAYFADPEGNVIVLSTPLA